MTRMWWCQTCHSPLHKSLSFLPSINRYPPPPPLHPSISLELIDDTTIEQFALEIEIPSSRMFLSQPRLSDSTQIGISKVTFDTLNPYLTSNSTLVTETVLYSTSLPNQEIQLKPPIFTLAMLGILLELSMNRFYFN